MSGRGLGCFSTIVASVALLLACTASHAQQAAPALNYFPGGAEVAGRAPDLLVHFRDNLFSLLDPLDASVVIVSRDGRVVGRSLPLPFVPTAVNTSATMVEFVDSQSGRRAVLERSADPSQPGALRIVAPGIAPASAATPALQRRGSRQVDLRAGSSGQTLRVRSLGNGYLSDVKLLGRDQQGRIYVQTSELVRERPALEVRVSVQRFASNGALLDVANVPIAEMDSVPSRYVAVSPSGDASAIVPTSEGLFFQSLVFRRSGQPQPAAASPAARTPINTVVHKTSQLEPQPDRADAPQPAAALPPATRQQIMNRAEEYLNVNWTMRAENFSRAGIDNLCAKEQGKYWLRPHRFTTASIGQTFGLMPYHWGGGDTKVSFLRKLNERNFLAGSVCTCREEQHNYCVVGEAAGVDCSGFVSGAWGIAQRGTSTLHRVADPVGSLGQLRPGDVLNRAGNHVRLFVRHVPGAVQRVEVIESTTDQRCEGACRSTYTIDQLNRYQPLRYKAVQE